MSRKHTPSVRTILQDERPADWDELYERLQPVVLRSQLAADESKKAQKSKRKQPEDTPEAGEEKEQGKRQKTAKGKAQKGAPVLTPLRPPDASKLEKLVDLMWFNLEYWRGWNNEVLRKIYFPQGDH